MSKLKLLKSNHTAQQYEMEDKVTRFYPQKIKETEFAEKSACLNQLNIELDMTGKGEDCEEPEREDAPRDGGKPSILKALKQFDAHAPASAHRQRSHERGMAL